MRSAGYAGGGRAACRKCAVRIKRFEKRARVGGRGTLALDL